MAVSCKVAFALGLFLASTATWARASAPSAAIADLGTPVAAARARIILQKARAHLYRLWGAGMGELRCQVEPDWDGYYDQIPVNSIDRVRLLPLLRPVRLNVVIARDVSVTLTHQPDVAATASADIAAGVRSSISGIEQALSGFLAEWTFLSVDTPLPNDQIPYKIESMPAQFRVTYSDSTNAVQLETMLSTEFVIEQVTSTTPALTTIIRPSWTSNPAGLLLTGFEGEAKFSDSSVPLRLLVKIETQTVDGLQLPLIVRQESRSNDSVETLQFTFSECHNTK
jgi:hypothetical protein